jgi:hypothetical protein
MRQLAMLLLFAAILCHSRPGAAGEAGSGSAAGTCGNKLIDAGETCAQCSADCAVQPCKPTKSHVVFAVDFTPPATPDITTAVLRVGYRSDRLSLPGTGAEKSVQSRLTSPSHSLMAFNDMDYALRIVASHAKAIPEGRLVTVEFDRCEGAPAPTASDLSCEIETCAASTGPSAGCRCQIIATQ